jgi:hypothetical protein
MQLAYDNDLVTGQGLMVQPGTNARPFGRFSRAEENSNSESFPAATVAPMEKGRIAALYFNFSPTYLKTRSQAGRKFLNSLVRELFPKPLVEVNGSPDVDVVVNRIGGNLAINLINTAGPHRTEPIIDSIQPVGPLTLVLRQATKPSKVTLQPAGQELAFDYANGEARFTLPNVQVHDIIIVN